MIVNQNRVFVLLSRPKSYGGLPGDFVMVGVYPSRTAAERVKKNPDRAYISGLWKGDNNDIPKRGEKVDLIRINQEYW